MQSHNDTFQRTNVLKKSAINKENDEGEITPTESSIEDETSHHYDDKRRFIDTDVKTIKQSNERVDDWKTHSTVLQFKVTPASDDEEGSSTWL